MEHELWPFVFTDCLHPLLRWPRLCIIDGVNIQDYLQDHYIGACGVLADPIREYDNVSLSDDCIIGRDNMNEPFEGLCRWDDLNTIPARQGSTLKKGPAPTPAQGLRLGMGKAQTMDHWTSGMLGPSQDGTVTLTPRVGSSGQTAKRKLMEFIQSGGGSAIRPSGILGHVYGPSTVFGTLKQLHQLP
jgi:hypothetical protein